MFTAKYSLFLAFGWTTGLTRVLFTVMQFRYEIKDDSD